MQITEKTDTRLVLKRGSWHAAPAIALGALIAVATVVLMMRGEARDVAVLAPWLVLWLVVFGYVAQISCVWEDAEIDRAAGWVNLRRRRPFSRSLKIMPFETFCGARIDLLHRPSGPDRCRVVLEFERDRGGKTGAAQWVTTPGGEALAVDEKAVTLPLTENSYPMTKAEADALAEEINTWLRR